MPRSIDLAPFASFVDDPHRAAFLVDYDGSLAPIVDDPAAARALPTARAALARLVPLVARVAVVSGRPAAYLLEQLAIDGLGYVGLYGLEHIVDGERRVDERAEEWVPVISTVADELEQRLPGLLVERKGDLGVTVHWRTASDRADDAAATVLEVSAAHGLEAPMRGRMAMELRPPVPVDKGTVTAEIVRGMCAAAFAGDDRGDLPAFAMLRRLVVAGELDAGVCVGVRSPEAPPEILAADVIVDGPTGLVQLLEDLSDAISERG